MDCKISNFAFVHKALQILCKRLDCDFIDLSVKFEKIDSPCFQNGYIALKAGGNLLDTMAAIYSVYINAMGSICGRNLDTLETRNSLLKLFLSLLRDFKTEYNNKPSFDKKDVFGMKLDQFPVVWMLLKNIFCPYKQIPLKNLRVVAKSSEAFDAVVAIEQPDQEPSLFVNLDIEKNSVRSAFLLVEALRLHVKTEDSPEALIREALSNFFMKDRILDFLGVAFSDESEVANFLAVLSILCQSKDIENMALSYGDKKDIKTAQSNSLVGNFWFLGLTEKMMDMVRGPDWSTTKSLQDFSKDLWDKVEDERQRRGMTELPFELLLRVQSDGLQVPPNQTLQELLTKTRIW